MDRLLLFRADLQFGLATALFAIAAVILFATRSVDRRTLAGVGI